MEAPPDVNANIITAASLAPPDEIIAPSGSHTLGSNDGERIATEGWVLHQLDGMVFFYISSCPGINFVLSFQASVIWWA